MGLVLKDIGVLLVFGAPLCKIAAGGGREPRAQTIPNIRRPFFIKTGPTVSLSRHLWCQIPSGLACRRPARCGHQTKNQNRHPIYERPQWDGGCNSGPGSMRDQPHVFTGYREEERRKRKSPPKRWLQQGGDGVKKRGVVVVELKGNPKKKKKKKK